MLALEEFIIIEEQSVYVSMVSLKRPVMLTILDYMNKKATKTKKIKHGIICPKNVHDSFKTKE